MRLYVRGGVGSRARGGVIFVTRRTQQRIPTK